MMWITWRNVIIVLICLTRKRRLKIIWRRTRSVAQNVLTPFTELMMLKNMRRMIIITLATSVQLFVKRERSSTLTSKSSIHFHATIVNLRQMRKELSRSMKMKSMEHARSVRMSLHGYQRITSVISWTKMFPPRVTELLFKICTSRILPTISFNVLTTNVLIACI